MTIWSSEIRELEKLYETLKGQLPDLEKELGQLIRTEDANVILLYSRRCLEVIINDLCECELKRPRKTEPLKGIIDKLHKEGKVPSHIITSMHGLNELSTYGAHPKDFDPEQVKPVLVNLDIIIKWYLKYKGSKMVFKSKLGIQEGVIERRGENNLQKDKKSVHFSLIKFGFISLLFLLAGLAALIAYRTLNHRIIKKQIYTETIPRIKMLFDSASLEGISGEKCWEAFILASEAIKKIPDDTNLLSLHNKLTKTISIYSDPPGSDVLGKPYSASDSSWHFFGRTPLLSFNIPQGASVIKIVNNGYYDQLDAVFILKWDNQFDSLVYKLIPRNQTRDHNVFISGRTVKPNLNGITSFEPQWIGDFYIDKYEVTNEEFKEFVDDGGYLTPKYWKNKFIKDGLPLSWDKAMSLFRDQSNWLGPSGWISGQFPTGEAKKPVSGISWYEAAAFAEYRNKCLPTLYHWCTVIDPQLIPLQARNSNFGNNLIAQVGAYKGINRYGLYDIIGNVREWIHNQINDENYVFGGSVNDPAYSATSAYSSDPWERNELTGFRCIGYLNDTNKTAIEKKFNYIKVPISKNDKPVSDVVFRIFTRQFEYDKKPVEIINSTVDDFYGWKHEKVHIKSAYEGPDLEINIYLPNNVDPPFQSVIIFPGDDAVNNISQRINDYPLNHDFLLRSGRAIIMPQYYNTYGRGSNFSFTETKLEIKESFIKRIKDLQRTIDYMESRMDIDTSRIVYLGVSWGSFHAPYILAVEKRIKLVILNAFGLCGDKSYPEAYHINYLPHIKIPMLMLSGKYDFDWNYETQKLFYEWLGTSPNDKKWLAYEAVHGVPLIKVQKESLPWLDRYFGNPLNR
jgi:eukaryotic-like serine/threonine-protein kinase